MSTWLDIWSFTGLGKFPLAHDWLNRSKVTASRVSHRQKIVWNRGLWLVERPELRLLIGREHPPKILKGDTLTIQNLCQWFNFRSILFYWGGYIITGPSGCRHAPEAPPLLRNYINPIDIHLTSNWILLTSTSYPLSTRSWGSAPIT